MFISPQAIINPFAKIGKNVRIGPFSVIGPYVEIGEGTTIGAHVIIRRNTRIGQHNKIFQFSSIGDDPQDVSYHGEETWLEIGDHNIIREFCTINRGTAKDHSLTKMGNHNLLMAYTHIAHDCILGNHIILANMSTLGGHVVMHDHSMLGGGTLVHQFCQIGAYAFSSGGTGITRDVLPHVLVKGNPAVPRGLNLVGLRRHAFSVDQMTMLKKAYRVMFRGGNSLEKARAKLVELVKQEPVLKSWLDMLTISKRGIARPDLEDDEDIE